MATETPEAIAEREAAEAAARAKANDEAAAKAEADAQAKAESDDKPARKSSAKVKVGSQVYYPADGTEHGKLAGEVTQINDGSVMVRVLDGSESEFATDLVEAV